MQYDTIVPNNVNFFMTTIPDWTYNSMMEEIKEIEKDFTYGEEANDYLAGNIRKEFTLKKSKKILEPYIIELSNKYLNNNASAIRSEKGALDNALGIKLGSLWVNFQQKHEFNPNHTHAGVLSFVIWMQIPYTLAEEQAKGPGAKSQANLPGCFELSYTDVLGNICHHTIRADKTHEKKLLIFPAKLTHCVYPFYTSDDYRISVSGNIKFEVRN